MTSYRTHFKANNVSFNSVFSSIIIFVYHQLDYYITSMFVINQVFYFTSLWIWTRNLQILVIHWPQRVTARPPARMILLFIYLFIFILFICQKHVHSKCNISYINKVWLMTGPEGH